MLSLAQATGTDPMVPDPSDPFSACAMSINGKCPDPNLQPGRSTQTIGQLNLPKDIHTLNDAILAAAKELSTRPKDRRRIIFVISDGKEYGSKATWKEVVRYLQTNKIAVYGTLVGDTGTGAENGLTASTFPSQASTTTFFTGTPPRPAAIITPRAAPTASSAATPRSPTEARDQYTLGYLSHESIYDDKFRNIDVRVDRPNVNVIAKPGYYPSAQDFK